MSQEQPKVIAETFEPTKVWHPIKLINESRGQAYTIQSKMGWTEIVRDVLQDGTLPSSICALVNGRIKSANGWRCEFLD
jgi:nitrogen fixation protein